MSSITINSNLASLGTQRRLGNTTAELGRSYERLSSGLRINRASDDAAGLAIASGLNADNRVFNQGIRNLNDGLSLLNVADGALTELSNIVVRIRELAEQSANGTLSNQQREAIDQEAQELSDEFTRIAQTTEVNGLKLFDGSLGELSLQAGYGERGAVTSTLGGAIGDGSFSQASSFAVGGLPRSVTTADLNGDGVLDLVTAHDFDATVSVLLGETSSGVSPLLPFSLATKADALQAMAPLDRKIEQLAAQKGTIGAFQSRVETAINNLQVTSTNVKAAESRIADVDTAFEAAQLARLNILQQAGAAVLAQANQAPALVLSLL